MSWMSMFVSAVVTMAPFLSSMGWCNNTSERSAIAVRHARRGTQGSEERTVRVRQHRMRQQVGAALEGAPQRFLPSPPRNRTVIAREQDLGNRLAAERWRPRVLRILEQPIAKRLGDRGITATKHTGNQAADDID